jgi:4-diphosphocytidyl-2-C-methyl-D-erythritol kinase
MVLVNLGVTVSTAAVFAGLEGTDGPGMPDAIPRWRDVAEAAEWLARQRNDLEPAALRRAPVIAAAKKALAAEPACLLARMSGSGGTVFGLFASDEEARRTAERLAEAHPGWWVRATRALAWAPDIHEARVTT